MTRQLNSSESEKFNPFEGLKRKRLPGINMIAACKGGAPLIDSLASYFFMALHGKAEHKCLIASALIKKEKQIRQTTSNAESINNAEILSRIFGSTELNSLAGEEWSYLDNEETLIFYKLADTAIKEVQRWIANGSHSPLKIPLLGGEIVQRSPWTIKQFGMPDSSEERINIKKRIDKLRTEIETPAQPS